MINGGLSILNKEKKTMKSLQCKYRLIAFILFFNCNPVQANECEYRKGLVKIDKIITDIFEEEKGIKFLDVDKEEIFKYDGKVVHTKKTFITCIFSLLENGKKTVMTKHIEEDIRLLSSLNFGSKGTIVGNVTYLKNTSSISDNRHISQDL
jgi:hypothetical protein